jgi:hypothetical protein
MLKSKVVKGTTMKSFFAVLMIVAAGGAWGQEGLPQYIRDHPENIKKVYSVEIQDGQILTDCAWPDYNAPSCLWYRIDVLPVCNSEIRGAELPVNDAASDKLNSVIKGEGTYQVRACCDGHQWLVRKLIPPISSPSSEEIRLMDQKPLKCGKYQHVERWSKSCVDAFVSCSMGEDAGCREADSCHPSIPHCVDDKPEPNCVLHSGSVNPKDALLDCGLPEPLKCGKYQHAEYPSMWCGDTGTCFMPRCVDDMHWITEREWQELMARLKALETKAK